MSGLQNYGSTCYINSVVQILRYCKPVVKALVNVRASELVNLFVDTLYQDSDIKPFLEHIVSLGFDVNSQEDAHEFLLKILDRIYEETSLKNPFEGTLITQCKCPNGHVSTTKQPFVSIPIHGSIQDGIDKMMEAEEVECTCEVCGTTRATKTVDFEPGEVLCFHVQRFQLDKKLRFEVSIEETWMNYRLVGICNHVGNLYGGHYSSIVKTSTDWITADDDRIKKVKELPTKSRMPYLFVYVQNK